MKAWKETYIRDLGGLYINISLQGIYSVALNKVYRSEN